jgi:pre-mRNA-processing factor 6
LAKIFWNERKGEKVKKWIKNAITINKDNGDAWIYYLRYELEFGNQESIEDAVKQFEEAEPRHGEIWTKEVKKVDNWRVNKIEILKKLAKDAKLFDEE